MIPSRPGSINEASTALGFTDPSEVCPSCARGHHSHCTSIVCMTALIPAADGGWIRVDKETCPCECSKDRADYPGAYA